MLLSKLDVVACKKWKERREKWKHEQPYQQGYGLLFYVLKNNFHKKIRVSGYYYSILYYNTTNPCVLKWKIGPSKLGLRERDN